MGFAAISCVSGIAGVGLVTFGVRAVVTFEPYRTRPRRSTTDYQLPDTGYGIRDAGSRMPLNGSPVVGAAGVRDRWVCRGVGRAQPTRAAKASYTRASKRTKRTSVTEVRVVRTVSTAMRAASSGGQR